MQKQSATLVSALVLAFLLVACGDLSMRRADPVTTATTTGRSEVSETADVSQPETTASTASASETEAASETQTSVPTETEPSVPEPVTEATEPPAPTEPATTTTESAMTTSTATETETVPATTAEPDTSAPSPTPVPTPDEPAPETPRTTTAATTTEVPTATPTVEPTATPSVAPTPSPAPQVYDPGVYQVGNDLSAGDYLLSQPTHFQIAFESSFEPHVLIADKDTDGRTYVTLEGDDWFHFNNGQLYPQGTAPEAGDLPLAAGMYKAGQDLPAGEYVLLAEDSNLDLTVDARHLEPSLSATVIFNRAYVILADGQFIDFDMGLLYSAADAPPVPLEGDLPQGTYKIGTDLPAGTYTLRSTNPMYRSSYAVFSAPRQAELRPPVAGGFFTDEEITVTVADGQYLDVLQAVIVRP